MKVSRVQTFSLLLISLSLPACNPSEEKPHDAGPRVTVTAVQSKAVTFTRRYHGQVQSGRHIEIRTPAEGYLEAIPIKEGQSVKTGDLLFQVVPVLYRAELAAEVAERDLAQSELNNARSSTDNQGASQKEVQLSKVRLSKAQAKVDLAQAKLNLCSVRAPFDGIIDRMKWPGSLVKEGDRFATLSDNSMMRVYFNVPENRYLEYMTDPGRREEDSKIELILADGKKFGQAGKLSAIRAVFDSETGTIPFRADFPNPDHLLRHGQTVIVSIGRVRNDAIVIPQRATFEALDGRYVYVVDKGNVAHQREVVIQSESENLFVIKDGVAVGDKIVLDGVSLVRDGDKVEYEDRQPEKSEGNRKPRP